MVKKEDEEEGGEEKCLAVSVIHVHGQALHDFLDSGATHNVQSPKVIKMLTLNPKWTSRVVTVATGAKSGAMEKLTRVPVMFEDVQVNLEFIVF